MQRKQVWLSFASVNAANCWGMAERLAVGLACHPSCITTAIKGWREKRIHVKTRATAIPLHGFVNCVFVFVLSAELKHRMCCGLYSALETVAIDR